jgi:hypothetical protein
LGIFRFLPMKHFFFFTALGACALFLISGCNAFEAFDSVSTDQDRVEVGEACLRAGDFDCAITAYSTITDPSLRAEKLCAARLSQAGFGISELVEVLIKNSGSQKVLGRLAQALIGWTTARQAAADAAKTQCAAFRASAPPEKQRRAILFKALSAFVRCATLIAKTDVLRTEDGTTCDVPGPGTGTLTQSSISADATGAVSNGQPGMCSADVLACVEDFSDVATEATALSSQLPDIGAAFDNIPNALKNSATGDQVGRAAVRDAF